MTEEMDNVFCDKCKREIKPPGIIKPYTLTSRAYRSIRAILCVECFHEHLEITRKWLGLKSEKMDPGKDSLSLTCAYGADE